MRGRSRAHLEGCDGDLLVAVGVAVGEVELAVRAELEVLQPRSQVAVARQPPPLLLHQLQQPPVPWLFSNLFFDLDLFLILIPD